MSLWLGKAAESVRFWEDGWCDPNPLSTSYPLLYSLADSKEAKVVEVWKALGRKGVEI